MLFLVVKLVIIKILACFLYCGCKVFKDARMFSLIFYVVASEDFCE